ncbi:FAD-dependent oxidoreductase [Kineosporia sp. R_H_3]|uniref:FAD-dependent oxidoreductase n=1 Tax=Kineosporia sp. R_H_3 TaxID=1961848 RepID=UPI000B4AADCA|nr:FAD-dependent oxidoreductase [Kineosporia sp. R_H_3]
MTPAVPPGGTVLVVGGGVVGASAAYALTAAGYGVTLVTAGRVGDGASAGNAGLLVPADSVVWPGPENARAIPATLLGRSGTISVNLGNPATAGWGLRFLAASGRRRYDASCRAAHTLSAHSLAVTQTWAAQLSVPLYNTGMLFLVGSDNAVAAARHARAPLRETYTELGPEALAALDPAYQGLPPHLRVLYAPHAAQGDSHAFAQALAGELRISGAQVLENEPVTALSLRSDTVVGAGTATRSLRADAVVLAAGAASYRLARSAGVTARVLPVKGYSATVPLAHPAAGPRIGGVLEPFHVAFSRLEDRLRLSTGAEIGRDDHLVDPAAVATIRRAAELLFPDALEWKNAEYRAEHRPMTPHGLPLVGATRRRGLFLDTGHGSLGWTQAAGSADLLVDLVRGTTPAVDPAPFRPG